MTAGDLLAASLLVLTTTYSYAAVNYHSRSFQDPGNGAFSHMVLDKNTGNLYVGGVNHVYRLNPALAQEQRAVTGPQMDNPKCPPPIAKYNTCTYPLTSHPAYNKALVIDYVAQTLIACSTLFHGFCEKRSLSDVTQKEEDIYIPVVANNRSQTTVVFIALGPLTGLGESRQQNVLYVGAQYTTTGLIAARDLVPAFCSRKLDNFELAYKSISTSSKKEVQPQNRAIFPVSYIYGFGSENFSYMLTVQKEKTLADNYISKLLRVCQNDKNFYSYTEVALKCQHGGATYNLAQAAYLGRAGMVLASTLGIPTTEDVLYVVFSIGNPNSPVPTPQSALCVYPMREVRRMFTTNIKACFNGSGNIGPDHIVQEGACGKSVSTSGNGF
jgi:plexin A